MLRGFHLGVGARRNVLEGGPASAEPLHVNRLGGARRESGAREAVEQGSEGMELGYSGLGEYKMEIGHRISSRTQGNICSRERVHDSSYWFTCLVSH